MNESINKINKGVLKKNTNNLLRKEQDFWVLVKENNCIRQIDFINKNKIGHKKIIIKSLIWIDLNKSIESSNDLYHENFNKKQTFFRPYDWNQPED